jgi:glycosyltransferase involved in cell wall biosynthesis
MLSICILTRNRVNHVRFLLDNLSIALSKFDAPCEVILLDNASSETLSDREINRYSAQFSFKIVQHKHNIGFASNFLAALNKAEGDWCWMLGDDDIYDFSKILWYFKEDNAKKFDLEAHSRISLIHINHSHFIERDGKSIITKSRVHAIDSDVVMEEASFLELISGSIGSLLFVSSNIYRLSAFAHLVNPDYLVASASCCASFAVTLIAIRQSQILVISDALIKDRLRGLWSMESNSEKLFRLELPCSIYASDNPAAIRAFIIDHWRIKSFLKSLLVGIIHKDIKRSIYYALQTFKWLAHFYLRPDIS